MIHRLKSWTQCLAMGMSYNNALNVVRICQRSTRKAIDIQENLVEKSILNRPRSKQTKSNRMNELSSTKETSVKENSEIGHNRNRR